VQELQKSDLVRNILQGTTFSPAMDSAIHEPEVDERMLASAQSATKTVIARSKTVSEDEVAAAVQAAPQSKAAAVSKAKPKPSADDLEIDLDGIGFDD
jgi:acyl-CoA reductase-like NAD-dependent aldehyde dehydrogenase